MNFMDIMGRVREVQKNLEGIEEKLRLIQITAESGAGLVKVTVNGNRLVVNMDIDESLLNPQDKIMVQDLVVAATNLAIKNVEEKVKEELKDKTESIFKVSD